MSKYLREIMLFIIQIFVFYILPKIAISLGPMGMVFLLLLIIFVLSITTGIILDSKLKYFYPFINSILFIPSIWIYYNESALVHSLWYFVISTVGLMIGIVFNKIQNKINDKNNL